MVLKKSNSPMNSGSSQKFCNRGSYKKNKHPIKETQNSPNLKIILKQAPSKYHIVYQSKEHVKALEKVYNYLGFNGPTYEEFYIGRNPESFHEYVDIRLNEKEYLELDDRMEELIGDKDFLKDEIGLAMIRVHNIRKLAGTGRFYKIKSRVFGNGRKNIYCLKRKKIVKRRKVNHHSRGVQRTHLFHNENKQDDDDVDESDNENDYHVTVRKKVIFQLTGNGHIDTRILSSPKSSPFMGKPKVKSRMKTKGCVNGSKSLFVKGFNRLQIKRDRNDCFSYESYDNDPFKDWLEDEYDSDNYVIDVDDMSYANHHRPFSFLGDYVDTSINNKRSTLNSKSKSNKKRNTSTKSETVFVNSASSQITVKHEKGSFELINAPFHNIDETTEDKREETHTDYAKHVSYVNEHYEHPIIDNRKCVNTKSTVTSEYFDSNDNFVKILLDITDSTLNKIAKTLPNSNESTFFVNKCRIVLANTFPPIFCIELKDSQCRLVLISISNKLTMDDLSWYFTLKCSQESVDFERSKRLVLKNFEMNNKMSITLNDLVELAISSMRLNTKTVVNSKTTVLTSVNKKHSSGVFVTSTNDNLNLIRLVSLDEAVNKLNTDKTETNIGVDSSITITLDKYGQRDNIAKVSTECEICFTSCQRYGAMSNGLLALLPCNHCYCYDCWKSHIFYHIRNGKVKIKCMYMGCQQELNSTALDAIVPQKYINRLRLQQKERMIDVSPRCKWCPKASCDKIAMINNPCQPIKEFGCPVSCVCNFVWCFSCQTKPHIPASCSQAAVYRKILSKMNNNVPQHVSKAIELKPCPVCGTPFEKIYGCLHMTCFVCSMEFCWHCLAPAFYHAAGKCDVDEDSKFSTYKLDNGITNTFPLKLFDSSLKINKKYNSLQKQNLQLWLKSIVAGPSSKNSPKQPFYVSVKLQDFNVLRQKAIRLAEECVAFLLECYNFLQYFNILASFAFLNNDFNKEINRGISEQSLRRAFDKLETCTFRLEEVLVAKKLHHLVMSENRCRMFLQSSREMYHKLWNYVPILQKLSIVVPTKPYEELDPIEYFKYL